MVPGLLNDSAYIDTAILHILFIVDRFVSDYFFA